MAKKGKEPAPVIVKKADDTKCPEGLPPWLATFADMMSLLLCFFVLLLSFANQDVSKFRSLMGSIKEAFGVQIKRPEAEFAAFSPSRYEREGVKLEQENKVLLNMVLQLKSLNIENEDLKASAKITTDDQGVIMRIPNELIFDDGAVTLKPGSEVVLQNVIKILKEYNFNLVVRGHTDDTASAANLYPSNWELSSARAASALRFLVEKGEVAPTRLKAVGYADSQPLVPNNTNQNREMNRRTEFYFHRPEVQSW